MGDNMSDGKFKVGMRVKMVNRTFNFKHHRSKFTGFGTVKSVMIGGGLIVVHRDGVKNPDTWDIKFWEPVNESSHPSADN